MWSFVFACVLRNGDEEVSHGLDTEEKKQPISKLTHWWLTTLFKNSNAESSLRPSVKKGHSSWTFNRPEISGGNFLNQIFRAGKVTSMVNRAPDHNYP